MPVLQHAAPVQHKKKHNVPLACRYHKKMLLLICNAACVCTCRYIYIYIYIYYTYMIYWAWVLTDSKAIFACYL
jgi:hypothetical protein